MRRLTLYNDKFTNDHSNFKLSINNFDNAIRSSITIVVLQNLPRVLHARSQLDVFLPATREEGLRGHADTSTIALT